MVIQNEKRDGHFQQILALWKLEQRVHSGENQIIPTFVGRVLRLFGTETFQTVLTFLPPIPCPITEFSTVCETIHRSIHLSKISNMKCRHITVDVGAAEKYYKVIWNNPDEFEDVIIHLGDFHAFMHFFSNCGKFVTNSGFGEIVYQARMCLVGGIKPVLSGKSYNMCWRIREVVAEAISRLFQEQYVAPFISEKLVEQSKSDHTTLKNSKEFEEYYAKYVEMQKRCNAGEFGVTGKYWTLYVRIIDLIHQLDFAININNYYLRVETWEELMVLSFTINKQNFARYGTYYLKHEIALSRTTRVYVILVCII